MLIAITREVSSSLGRCALTYRQRQPIDVSRAVSQHRAYQELLRRLGARVIELPEDCHRGGPGTGVVGRGLDGALTQLQRLGEAAMLEKRSCIIGPSQCCAIADGEAPRGGLDRSTNGDNQAGLAPVHNERYSTNPRSVNARWRRGWQVSNTQETPARITSTWTFLLDGAPYRSCLLVKATGEAHAYTVKMESHAVRPSTVTWEDEAVDLALLLLRAYWDGIMYAFLSEASRSELGIVEELTPEDVALARQLLQRSKSEAAKRTQLREAGSVYRSG